MNSLVEELPYNTLGYPLNTFFKILVYYLIPYSLTLVLYITLILSDIGLVYYHFIEGNPRWASATLIFMFIPSIAGIIFTLVQPDRWPAKNPLDKSNLKFLALRLWHLIGFPFAATYRYMHQIFWAMEAMCADFVSNIVRRENALRILMKPNSLEFYFFLQAYLHSAPQIFFQFYLLFTITDSRSKIASLQVLSIVSSLIRMAITTMAYQRFERRKVLGTYYPWTSKRMLQESKRISTIEERQLKRVLSEIEPAQDPDIQPVTVIPLLRDSYIENNNDELFEEPISSNSFNKENTYIKNKLNELGSNNDICDDDFKTSIASITYEEVFENDNQEVVYRKAVSIIDTPNVEYRKTQGLEMEKMKMNIVDMSKHITPPMSMAPRPMSMAAIKERFVNNAEVLVDKIPRRRYKDSDDIDLPVRVRRYAIKGVEQEDGVSKLIAFCSWFLFIMCRMLVISSFAYFYLIECITICAVHYVVAVLLLIWNSWSENSNRKFFYLFLGYIYLFCLIEFKMKFRRVRLWYGLYFVIIFIENFFFTALWYWTTSAVLNWWFAYIIILIIGSCTLSHMCFLIYFLILKPKPITVYPTISTIGISPATV